jgi:holliday junction DNA helicase RuvA
MFSRIKGEVIDHAGDVVRIDVAGLAYDVVMPPSVAAKVPNSGEVTLEVYPSFALDGNAGRFTFFGFTNAIEREFFEALLSVASIGPKSAARAFSAPMARIAAAIENDDQVFLKKLPGIGQQKARDIVAKLQGKVARFLLIQDAPQRAAAAALPEVPPMPEFATEALAVLLQLAYKRGEAEAMIAATLERAPHVADAETLLAEIYRQRNGARA